MYLSDSKTPRIIKYIAGTGGSKVGALMINSSGTAILGGDGTCGAATILGIAKNEVAANGIVYIECIDNRLVTAPFTGATTYADTDIGKIYDLDAGGLIIDSTDTTGGFAILQGYDNTAKTITFIVAEANKYV